MKSMLIRISLLSLWLLLFIPTQSNAATEQRAALVIGNGSYSSGPLRNPVNDATDMAATLQKLGFAVIFKKNVSLREMEEAITDFGNRLKRGGVGLFYYAGHGLQVSGVNYLVPVGARIEKESDVKYEAVDAGRILDEMANANNGLNIVILDACRDNPYSRSFRSASRGLAIVSTAPVGTFISYSTGPGSVASDGESRNSPYTVALLQYMKEPGLTIENVFKKVRTHLGKRTGGKQIPWELSSLQGDFYFVPGTVKNKAGDKPQLLAERERLAEEQERLEADKRTLAAQRAQMEEQKRLAEEQRQLAEEKQRIAEEQARLQKERGEKEIASDGTLIAYDSGVVFDKHTGLEWFAGPDRGTTWNEAKAWIESLNVAGGGWRMPTRAELKTLYQKDVGTHNMTPLLKITGCGSWVWSGETSDSSSAWTIVFLTGYESRRYRDDSNCFRGFAVRSRRQ